MINNILEYTDTNDIEPILFSADFEKAFDSVEHSFSISTLISFGFGPDFIQWVKTFSKNVESVMNNGKKSVTNNGRSTGYSTQKRHPTRGSSSCIPFHFGPRNFFIQMRENADIKGIIIDGTEIKLSAYTDNGSFFVTDIHSFQIIFFICNQFREFSSFTLNSEKSEACWIDKAKDREEKPIDCSWISLYNDKIRILSV